VFPFDFSEDVVESALNRAKEHVEHYYPYRNYDEGAFANRSSFSPDSIVEFTRKQLLNSKEAALRTSGIYLIIHENGQTVYVGLAADFHDRFTRGIRKHSGECETGCGHWGHFVVPTTGAKQAGMPDGKCRFFILENIEHEGFEISQAEIDWYYLFVSNGWAERGSRKKKKVTNSPGSLGAKGRDLAPCIVCILKTGVCQYYASQNDAAEDLDTHQYVLAALIAGYQNQQRGFAARNATAEEVDADSLCVLGDRDVVWSDNHGNSIDEDQLNMNSIMRWNAGRLSESDIKHLRSTARGSYDTSIKSEFKRVYWQRRYEGWKWSAYKREFKADGVKRRERVSDNHPTDRAAAIDRERWIIKNKLTDINVSNFDWRPPEE